MALSANANREHKHWLGASQKSDRMLSTATIYKGAICTVVSLTGYLKPATDGAGEKFRGIAIDSDCPVVGVTGSAEVRCLVERGSRWRFCCDGGADQTWIGQKVYVVDDDTVALAGTTTNDVEVGICDEIISATEIWVKTLDR